MRAFFSPLQESFSRSCVSTCTSKKKNKGRRRADLGWLPGTSQFSCSRSFMQTLTNQKSSTVSSWLLIGLNLYERMQINQKRYHFLAPCCKAYLPNGQGSNNLSLNRQAKIDPGQAKYESCLPRTSWNSIFFQPCGYLENFHPSKLSTGSFFLTPF